MKDRFHANICVSAAMSGFDTENRELEQLDLLRAKLHRPRVTRDLVVRPRLLELLNRGLDGRLILVSAAAGFGKTTLISSWLKGMAATSGEGPGPPPAAWLSLDEHDGDLVVFLRYLVAALRTLFPGFGSETLSLLQAPQQVPEVHLFSTLNNEIEELPRDFLLVLDDYHLLEGQAVHSLFHELTHHWPRPLHLVLITRVDPPLPLGRLRATGKVTEIRTSDLRFNAEETAAYLDQVLDRPLQQQDRDLLEQQTGGWIAALQLAGISLRTLAKIESIPSTLVSTGQSLSEYLEDEVLAQQVPAIQTFLLKTSVLDRFCAPLCEAVVGEGDPAWSVRACIDWIDRAGLFVFRLDDQREWYRYHQLFRDFLQEKLLARFGAEGVIDLNRKAAAWFAQQGLLDEALRHALKVGDLELAAEVIEDGLRGGINDSDRPRLERWLSLLPEELVERRPWLLVLKAWVFQLSWQLGRQLKVLSQLEALIDEDGGATLPAEEVQLLRANVLALRAQEAFQNNQPARGVALSEEALAVLPPSWAMMRGAAMMYWGYCMASMGQDQATEWALLEEYGSLDDKTNAYAIAILFAVCYNYLNAGQLEPASRTAHVMLQQASRGRSPVLQGWAHFFLGLVSYQWNDLDRAGAYFAEVVGQHYLSGSLCVLHSMAGLVLVHQARGESSEARQVVEILSQFQLEQAGREEDEVRSLRAGLMLDQGDRESAFRWADAFTVPVPDRPLYWAEVPHITRARILLARNRADDVRLALEILDGLLDTAERTHNTRSKITILALRALALEALDPQRTRGEGDAQGHAGQALVTLREAVDLAQPGGFLRVFVDLGPQMKELLGRLARDAAQSSAAEPIFRILAAFPGSGLGKVSGDTQPLPERSDRTAPGVPAAGVLELVEPLTPRELQILTLLRDPLYPKEIARQLDISYLTVKRHALNVYGKLGVNTRWEAVNRAVELGILPPR
jgi:LuxR family transcriptional regulator, maltose regulon positive regulatory protein